VCSFRDHKLYFEERSFLPGRAPNIAQKKIAKRSESESCRKIAKRSRVHFVRSFASQFFAIVRIRIANFEPCSWKLLNIAYILFSIFHNRSSLIFASGFSLGVVSLYVYSISSNILKMNTVRQSY